MWKNVTANTVPKGLRHLDAHTDELNTELYKNVKETQRIVFNPRRAVKARRKELLRLMEWFEHYGMMPKLQRELLYNNGLKAVVYLGLIGGGHKVLQSNNKFGRSPFGTRISKAGRRAPNARLAAAGCRMLVGAAWSNPKIRRLANDLSVIAELLKLAKVHRRDIDVVLPVPCPGAPRRLAWESGERSPGPDHFLSRCSSRHSTRSSFSRTGAGNTWGPSRPRFSGRIGAHWSCARF